MNKGEELRKILKEFYFKIEQNKRDIKDFMGIYDYHLKKDPENRNRKLMEKYIIKKEKELIELKNKREKYRKQIIEGIEKNK